jgi:hypothetical protein
VKCGRNCTTAVPAPFRVVRINKSRKLCYIETALRRACTNFCAKDKKQWKNFNSCCNWITDGILTMKNFNFSKKAKRVEKKQKFLNPYLREIRHLRKTIPEWESGEFFTECNVETQCSNWIRLEVMGQPLCEKYSWAIPNNRALNILASFSPLIEIGAGKGYWASLLREQDIDIVAYDKTVDEDQCWTEVKVGGPKKLASPKADGRTLFLCYPDDSQNLGLKCLNEFRGDYIIHVGELITTGTLSGYPQAPFGRTTGSDFSVALAENFHCLLSASLPRFPFSKDCITVWKRTTFVPGKSLLLQEPTAPATNSENSGKKQKKTKNSGVEDDEEEEEEEDCWASIPTNERLPINVAAPCLRYLLER